MAIFSHIVHTHIYKLGTILGFNQNKTKLFRDEMGYLYTKRFYLFNKQHAF